MVESNNDNSTFEEMARGFARDFSSLPEGKREYETFFEKLYWTPPDGITMGVLKNFARNLSGKEVSASAIPYLSISEGELKMVVGADVDKNRLKQMAELMIFMQEFTERMDLNKPLYEFMKAIIWYVNSLFGDAKKLRPNFDFELAEEGIDALEMDIDETMMPAICAQYMSNKNVRSKLEVLIERGAEFDIDDPQSFYEWLPVDDYYVFAKQAIGKDLEGVENAVSSSMKERLKTALSLANQPEPKQAVDNSAKVTLKTLRAVLRATTEKAVPIPEPDPLHTAIQPMKIFQVGDREDKK